MNDKAIRECYAKIVKDVIEGLKEEAEIVSQLSHEQIAALEEVVSFFTSHGRDI
jgi:hypothetical protein